jgi:hypothetical protein
MYYHSLIKDACVKTSLISRRVDEEESELVTTTVFMIAEAICGDKRQC